MIPSPQQYNARAADHLRQQVERERQGCLAGTMFFHLACLVAVFLTFWFIYLAQVLTLDRLVRVPHAAKLLLSAVGVAGLFMAHRKTGFIAFDEYPLPPAKGRPADSIYLRRGGWGNYLLFPPLHTAQDLLKLAWAILLVAPQLAAAGRDTLKRRRWLAELDVTGCAALLGYLIGQPKKVPFQDLPELFPQYSMPVLVPQLAVMEGVVVLTGDPPGLTVTEDLRNALRDAVMGSGIKPLAREEPAPSPFVPPPPAPPRKPIRLVKQAGRLVPEPSVKISGEKK